MVDISPKLLLEGESLRKEIYPRKSSPNLKQVIFFTLLFN